MSSRWAPFPPVAPGRPRVFCVPCAGHGASAYRAWQQVLAPELDAVPIQLPGREGHRSADPATSMDQLMEQLVPVVREQVTEHYALFGHSMGGAVAYELGRRLAAEGKPPALVVVAAQRPPGEHDALRLHDLPDAAFMTVFGLLGQVPVELFEAPEALRAAVSVLRADLALIETYAPTPADGLLGAPLTALGGLADRGVPASTLRGWSQWTTGDFTMRPVPGDHFFVYDRVEEIAALIRAQLLDGG